MRKKSTSMVLNLINNEKRIKKIFIQKLYEITLTIYD